MIICVCAFTEEGRYRIKELNKALPEITWQEREKSQDLKDWARDAFSKHLPLLFVGATGIAVRTIAPFVEDKFQDSPVLVLDELGENIIPILSGHIGGANDLALLISEAMGCKPIITTATDVEKVFSVDMFAKKNGFHIVNRQGIAKVSSKLLAGERVTVYVEPDIILSDKVVNSIPKELVLLQHLATDCSLADNKGIDIYIGNQNCKTSCMIQLVPKMLCAGIGCKKGKSFEELKSFVENHLQESLQNDQIFAIASIDLKKDEMGLMTLAQYYHLPFVTFSAEELETVEGNFTESDFVKGVTGVSNVCERSAMALAGEGAALVQKKIAENGMTLAVTKRVPVIRAW